MKKLVLAVILMARLCSAQTISSTVNFTFNNAGADVFTKTYQMTTVFSSGNRVGGQFIATTNPAVIPLGGVTNLGTVIVHNNSGITGSGSGWVRFSSDGTNWCAQVNSNEWAQFRMATNTVWCQGQTNNVPFNYDITSN